MQLSNANPHMPVGGPRALSPRSASADTHPTLDPLADQQARFRITGTGPVSQRSVVPASSGARLITEAVGAQPVEAAVRSVLRVVEDAAGGAAASSKLRVNGIAFAADDDGLAAATYRAHVDDDAVLQQALGTASSARGRQKMLHEWAADQVPTYKDTHANVIAGWMNLGPKISDTVLWHHGVRAPGAAKPDAMSSAESVRLLRHEAQHLGDQTRPKLPNPHGVLGMREALAEAHATDLASVQRARTLLGLDGAINDAMLAASLERERPYRGVEQVLAGVQQLAGIAPGSAESRTLLQLPSSQVADVLIERMQRESRASEAQLRAEMGRAFASALGS